MTLLGYALGGDAAQSRRPPSGPPSETEPGAVRGPRWGAALGRRPWAPSVGARIRRWGAPAPG